MINRDEDSMKEVRNIYFIAAATLTAIAALVHLGCIIFGGDWYRFLGAGEQMAKMADDGLWYPTLVTLAIVIILLIWSLYALSGAKIIPKLPLLRLGLTLIAIIFLVRGVAFVFIMPFFPGNSLTFWLVSSGICLSIGLLYVAGIMAEWGKKNNIIAT